MTATLLDGELLAAKVRAEVTDRVARLRSAGVTVGLGTILVGDDGPSSRYVAMKHADCDDVGIRSAHEHLPADVSQAELEAVVARFNADPGIHAFLVQLPLPAGLDEERVLMAVDPDKDVDGLHPVNLGRLVMGANGPLPCTPAGIVELLHANDVPVEGKHVVVIGRGLTIGRPLALLLAMKRPGCNAAVTVVHTGVEDLAGLVRQGDVVVAAAGRAGLVTPDMVKPGAAVVGAGTSWEGKKLLSDVDEVRRRGRRVDHPAHRRGGSDDPGHAVAQCRACCGTLVVSGQVPLETDQRPWGSYTVLDDAAAHKVKRVEVLPGKRLSYQRHARRSEHWFIVSGTALVTLDGVQSRALAAGDSVDIPAGTAHRLENATETDADDRLRRGAARRRTSGRTTSSGSRTTIGRSDR
jgi:methylenetetrahydrofolate dehydrogenase (NADP+)/methenyltetrahydrofolate cyclohydrolase